jgi:hypothetical protein
MQFIRLPKPIDIAERVLPELVADWADTESASAKNISICAEWLRQSGRAASEPSETPWGRITPHPASIQRVAFHIAV